MKTAIASGTIRTWAVPVLEAQIKKLNKRAAKCKCEPLTLRVAENYEKVVGKDALGSDIVLQISDVEIEGIVPRINGWTLVAKITPAEGAEGNFIKAVPGIGSVHPKYRTIKMRCDHCKRVRRRNDVFVIRNAKEEERVIGRNCLADFVRTIDFEALIAWADFVDKTVGMLEEDTDWEAVGSGHVKPTSLIEYWLETTSICIRKLGWLSRGKAREIGYENSATADIVTYLHWVPDQPQGSKEKYCQKNDLYTTDFDKELAIKALEWVRKLENIDSDYLYNLKLACSREYVDHETAGLVSSLIQAYQRAMEKEIKQAKFRKAAALRKWIGTVGKRERNLKLTVLGTNSYEGSYGPTTLIRFSDDNGNTIVWWASGDRTEEFLQGDTYVVDATVKKYDDHETYGKQTVVNRITVKEELGAVA